MNIDAIRTALVHAAPPRLRQWFQGSANWRVNSAMRRAWASVGYRADIPWATAEAAYSGTSHSPERRAETVIEDYARHMEMMAAKLTPEQFEEYRAGYRSRYLAWLHAKSSVMSSFITGPSNFPLARQEKKLATEDNRRNDLEEWSSNFLKKVEKAEKKAELEAAGGPLAELERAIEKRKKDQVLFKSINAIVKKKGTEEAKIAALMALGLSEKTARSVMEEVYGEVGIPAYQLTNNLKEIKRLEERLEVERRKSTQQDVSIDFDAHDVFPAGTVTYDTGADRLQVQFVSRLPRDVYEQMKSRGFNTTRDGIFQRKLTDNAVATTSYLLNVKLPRLGAAAEPSPGFLRIPVPPVVAEELEYAQSESMDAAGISIEKGMLLVPDSPEGRAALKRLVANVRADFDALSGFERDTEEKKAMLAWAKGVK